MYHSINDDKNPLSVSKSNFEKQMYYLHKNKYQTISFDKLNERNDKKKFIIFLNNIYRFFIVMTKWIREIINVKFKIFFQKKFRLVNLFYFFIFRNVLQVIMI